MKETLSKKIYNTALTVMVFSLLLLPFVSGAAPFNLTLAWSEQGLGTSMVLLQADAAVAAGSKVAGTAGTVGEVHVYTVLDTFRKDGSVYYEVAQGTNANETMSVVAGKYGQQALLSIPFLGTWVQTLMHPLGAFLLLGLPLVMLALNLLTPAFRKLLPVLSVLEKRAMQARNISLKRKAVRRVKTHSFTEQENKTDNRENEYVTVLKPLNRHNYSV